MHIWVLMWFLSASVGVRRNGGSSLTRVSAVEAWTVALLEGISTISCWWRLKLLDNNLCACTVPASQTVPAILTLVAQTVKIAKHPCRIWDPAWVLCDLDGLRDKSENGGSSLTRVSAVEAWTVALLEGSSTISCWWRLKLLDNNLCACTVPASQTVPAILTLVAQTVKIAKHPCRIWDPAWVFCDLDGLRDKSENGRSSLTRVSGVEAWTVALLEGISTISCWWRLKLLDNNLCACISALSGAGISNMAQPSSHLFVRWDPW